MSAQSERISRQLKAFRDRNGEDVLFNGTAFRAFVEEVSGARAGEQALSHGTFGIYVASAAPAIFDFSPLDFAPHTDVVPPKESDEITRNNLTYVVTSVDYENEDTDTGGFFVYALRKIWATPAPAP